MCACGCVRRYVELSSFNVGGEGGKEGGKGGREGAPLEALFGGHACSEDRCLPGPGGHLA